MPPSITHYGWVVAVAGMLVIATLSGAGYSYGVFLKPLSSEFQWTRSAVSGVVSLQAVLMGVVGALAGALADRYGYRRVITAGVVLSVAAYLLMAHAASDGAISLWQLYLYLGVIAGSGLGATYSTILALIARWFGSKGTLPMGIATAGFSLGQIALPLLSAFLLTRYGWSWPFLVLALAVAVVGFPSAIAMKEEASSRRTESSGDVRAAIPGKGSFTLSAAVRTGPYWYVWAIYLISAVSLQMLIFHVIAYATDVNIDPAAATLILTIMGAGTLLARLTVSRLVSRIGLKYTMAFAIAIQIPVLFWLIGAREVEAFYAIALVYGLAQGALSPVIPTLAVEYFGPRWVGALIGFLGFGYALGSVLGPIVAGVVVDLTHSYVIALVLIGILTAASLGMSLVLKRPAAP